MRVFINPGHMPGVDPGAVNEPHHEADITLAVGEKLANFLEAAGVEVTMLQSDNLYGESPIYKCVAQEATVWKPDLFLSLHCNASGGDHTARGAEALVYSMEEMNCVLAATHVLEQLVGTMQTFDEDFPDRGLKERPALAVLNLAICPAVLLEMAFIDNDKDCSLLTKHIDDIAAAIARGVTDYEVQLEMGIV